MNEKLERIFDLLAPGKPIRKGIDRIMEANLGALLFFCSQPEKYLKEGLIHLGFRLDSDFLPEKIYELSKMDGAIVLNYDGTKILAANTQLNPDKNIPSSETGMRHKTAEKVSIQTGDLTVAVSKRRNIVSVYYNKIKYELLPENVLFARLNQEITIAQRYRQNFMNLLDYLNIEEARGNVSLSDVVEILSKGLLTIKIVQKAEKYLLELGEIAGSAKLEYEEILRTIPKDVGAVIMDYSSENLKYQKPEDATDIFKELDVNDLVDPFTIAKTLGYIDVSSEDDLEETTLTSRGYRILYSTRLPTTAVKKVVESFKNLQELMNATFEELTNVSGIGKRRAEIILGALNKKKREKEELEQESPQVIINNDKEEANYRVSS
ncbi:DNA integrity scanning diadenylate cyclase DisA [Petrotoga olearia]|uniref:DNA-binding protein n=2 Tax=Petrotoga olearia TaxID=156203 RepID=A0A2K1P5I1_9BACT|nr:DNA integrity scanning diadenylate cyclase DisA [Petrotoga olearia]PNR97967.1 DNA-binding protein [Petrotoga olearia DSM 13574]RMA75543.1 diadenylate cyclase [Petrotoga olearia]